MVGRKLVSLLPSKPAPNSISGVEQDPKFPMFPVFPPFSSPPTVVVGAVGDVVLGTVIVAAEVKESLFVVVVTVTVLILTSMLLVGPAPEVLLPLSSTGESAKS